MIFLSHKLLHSLNIWVNDTHGNIVKLACNLVATFSQTPEWKLARYGAIFLWMNWNPLSHMGSWFGGSSPWMCFKHSFRFIIIRESWCLVWSCCSNFLSLVKITQPHWGQTLMFAAWYICMSTKYKWEEFTFVTWSISACFDVISERCPPVHGGNWGPGISKVWMEDMGIHQKKGL